MIRGLYTSAAGMLAEQYKQDVISNNLANVNTTGFKKDEAVFRTFPEMLIQRLNDPDSPVPAANQRPTIGTLGTGALLDQVVTLNQEGPLKPTNGALDFAINGTGYFTVQTPLGQRYTRNGNFQLAADSTLVTGDGFPVLGQKGQIKITSDNYRISKDGTLYIDGNQVDKLQIVNLTDPQAKKAGNSLWQSGQVQAVANPEVLQGYLEQSNVNSITEMVNMITAVRSYEANQKAIQAHDHLLDKAVNEVGRI